MSESLKGFSGSTNIEQSDWDALTELSMDSSNKQKIHDGPSFEFKEEAKAHRETAENFFSQSSYAQVEELKRAGIRDAQDAGEYLHEKASWNRQVEHLAKSMDLGIKSQEKTLSEQGRFNGVDPITGEHLPDSPFAPIEDKASHDMWQDNFQKSQEEFILPTTETEAVSRMIRSELQIPDNKESQESPLSQRERLKEDAINKWLATVSDDAEKNKEIHNSVFYATLKRKIQREVEEQRAKAEKESV